MGKDIYNDQKQVLRNLWFEKRAAADKLYHDAAMAGIGFEVAIVTAFGAPHLISAVFHAVTVVTLVTVIPVYRKILQLNTEFLENELDVLDIEHNRHSDEESAIVGYDEDALPAARQRSAIQVKKAKWWDAAYSQLFHIGLVSFVLSAFVAMYFVSTQAK